MSQFVTWKRLSELVSQAHSGCGAEADFNNLMELIREEGVKAERCQPGCELRGGHTGNCAKLTFTWRPTK